MNPRAFTLIELLVVVAIIVALLAILLPSMGKATETAMQAVCRSNLHQVSIASLSYAADNKGEFIPTFFTHNAQSYYPRAWGVSWWDAHATRYGLNEGVMQCPSQPVWFLQPYSPGWTHWVPDGKGVYYSSYAYVANPSAGPASNSWWRDWNSITKKVTDSSSRTYMAADGLEVAKNAFGLPAGAFRSNHVGTGFDWSDARDQLWGVNVAFGDGHTEWRHGSEYPAPLKNAANQSDSPELIHVNDSTNNQAFYW